MTQLDWKHLTIVAHALDCRWRHFTADIFDEFADDHDVWAEHFLDAWVIMMNNGASGLIDAPQNSWLGHYTIKGNFCDLTKTSGIKNKSLCDP